ncbi:MAG TPA: hypothetical protein PKY96_08965 [Flavobacteriales bacterium]|nr:hypothetical protein [Flavobacteriales bacterium]
MSRAILELVEILSRTRELLARPDSDFAWSHWSNSEDALREFDSLTRQIEAGDFSRKKELELLFAPTGSIQEVSINSGWGDEFLKLSEKFDSLMKRV